RLVDERRRARPKRQDRDERDDEEGGGGRVDGDGLDREDDSAERRTGDDTDLTRKAAQSDRPLEEVDRDDLGRERAERGIAHRRGDAGERADGQEGPEALGAGERDRDEHRRDGHVDDERSGG